MDVYLILMICICNNLFNHWKAVNILCHSTYHLEFKRYIKKLVNSNPNKDNVYNYMASKIKILWDQVYKILVY